MVNGILWFFAIFWLCLIAAAFTQFRFKGISTIALYWFMSWLGQTFAVQLGLLSGLLSVVSFTSINNDLLGLVFLINAWLFFRMHSMGHRSAMEVEAVVEKALSPLKVTGAVVEKGSPSTAWAGFRPFHYGSGVSCQKNIAYGDQPGRNNLLDIYQPSEKPNTLMPILIQVPGGAWVTGNKEQQALPLLHSMARQGWACFSINYRLGPTHRFPAMLEDVLKAIAWVKEHAAEYGANSNYVVLTGGSAGGHLVSLAGLIQERAALQPGFEQADTRVNLVVPFYGRYDFLNIHGILPGQGLEPFLSAKVMSESLTDNRALWELGSPELQVHADAPPFFIVHGSHDSLIPVEEGQHFVEALRKVSTSAVHYAQLKGAEHAFDIFNTSWCTPTVAALTKFLVADYANYQNDKDPCNS